MDIANDEKFAAAERAIDEEKLKRGFGSLGLKADDPHPPAQLQSTALFMLTRDYRTAGTILTSNLNKEGSLKPYELAALAFCQVMTGDNPDTHATKAIEQDPLLPLAYAALACAASSDFRVFESLRFASLMKRCCDDSVTDHWFTFTVEKINYLDTRVNLYEEQLKSIIVDDERRLVLLNMFPELNGNEEFEKLLTILRETPDLPNGKLTSSSSAFKEILFNNCRDMNPELLIESKSDKELAAVQAASEAPIARLSPTILAQISGFLTLNEVGLLRRASHLTNAMFDHWSVWRAQHLRLLVADPNEKDETLFWGPIDELEWKTLARYTRFVHRSIHVMNEDPLDFTHGAPSQLFPTADMRKELKKLILTFRLPLAPVPENELPEIQYLWMWQCMNTYHQRGIMGAVVAHEAAYSLSQMVLPIYTYSYGLSYLFSLEIVTSLCWMYPELAATFNHNSYAVGARTSQFRLACASHGVTSVLAWRALLPKDFKLHPMPSLRPPPHRKRPQTLLPSSELPSTPPASYSMLAGIEPRKTFAGVYRLLLSYSHSELEYERDLGIVELFQDLDTFQVSGHGIDTLKGSFKILDGRSAARREQEKEYRTTSKDLISEAGLVPAPSHLVLVYEDQTELVLELGDGVFAFGGPIAHVQPLKGVADPDYAHAQSQSFGSYSLLYDHRITVAEGEERESLWKAEFDEISKKKILVAPAVQWRIAPFHRSEDVEFKPWTHDVKSTHEAIALTIGKFNEFLSILLVCPSFMELVEINEQTSDWQPEAFPETTPLIMDKDLETTAVYELRVALWNNVVASLVHTIANCLPHIMKKDDVATVYDRVAEISQLTEAASEQEIMEATMFITQIWDVLRLHPRHRFLGNFLGRIFYAALHSFPDSEAEGSAFMNALGSTTSSHGKNKNRSGGFLKWLKSPVGMIIATIGLSVSIGAAAFVAGTMIARSSKKKN